MVVLIALNEFVIHLDIGSHSNFQVRKALAYAHSFSSSNPIADYDLRRSNSTHCWKWYDWVMRIINEPELRIIRAQAECIDPCVDCNDGEWSKFNCHCHRIIISWTILIMTKDNLRFDYGSGCSTRMRDVRQNVEWDFRSLADPAVSPFNLSFLPINYYFIIRIWRTSAIKVFKTCPAW